MSEKKQKFLKPGKVVIVLNGRMAGKKAVIVKTFDDGTHDRPYGHCVVAGISKHPLKITKNMPKKKIAKRSRVKPFIKCVNYNHLMPTRYSLDISEKSADLKQIVTTDVIKDASQRPNARKEVKKMFEDMRDGQVPKTNVATRLKVAHECDLATLQVEDARFWEGVTPLKLGAMPSLQDEG